MMGQKIKSQPEQQQTATARQRNGAQTMPYSIKRRIDNEQLRLVQSSTNIVEMGEQERLHQRSTPPVELRVKAAHYVIALMLWEGR
jgi:hypothetical protein